MPETEAGEGAGTAFLILTLKEQGCLFPLSTPRDCGVCIEAQDPV